MLTDAAWAQLAPLLPPQKPRTGRPAKPHRTVLEGILWVLRTERPQRRFDRAAYREQNRVERLVGRSKQCRRVATRYEKRAVHFLSMVTIAALLLWL